MPWLRFPLLLAGLLLATPAQAHIVTEAPWHPLAYAHRTAIFLINLEPIDWPLVAQTFTSHGRAQVYGPPADEVLKELDEARGTVHWPMIERALAQEDRHGLFTALTRATSHATRHHLERAVAHLEQPGQAARELNQASEIYRSFEDFIQETDPDGFRELGLAWLDLASSVGTSGVLQVGVRPADHDLFAEARATIERYLLANYEPEAFAPRQVYAPVPERRFLAEPQLTVAPWLPPGADLNDQDPLPRLILNFEQLGIDERSLFLVAFGDTLFDSPEIFGEPARSLGLACSTCHNRSDINQRFFIPGISHQPGSADVDGSFFNPRFNDHRSDSLDIPSLRGLRFTAPYGRDGRFASLRDFTRNVIVNEFAGPEPDPLLLDALVTYMLEFDFLPAPFLESDGRLNDQAPEAARRGEALFRQPFDQMSGRSCASCHVPDSHFTDNRGHNIGSGPDGYAGGLSSGFVTPTLLGAAYTAPYFHDGSLPTLADVVAWFDQRYGLGLDPEQQADLTAYLQAVGTGEEPYEVFDEAHTPFRLMVEELSTFLSTFDRLLADRDQARADLLLRTVAADLEADASAMTNRSAVAKAHEMAGLLWQVRAAVKRDDWADAEEKWAAYRDLEQRYDLELR